MVRLFPLHIIKFGQGMFLIRRDAQGDGECGGVFCGQKTGLDIERPPGGTSAATRPLHAHRREAMEQIARGAAAVRLQLAC